MASFTVLTGTTQITRISMSGTDDLTVQAGGTLSISASAQSVRFNGATTNGLITNSGTIENTAPGGRAIRVETTVGSNFVATFINNATGIITSSEDAIQIQAGVVTAGSLALTNAGTITCTSAAGQAVDLAGGTGTFTVTMNNSGTIGAIANDAVRFGGIGNLTNSGTINGGTDAAFATSADGVQYDTPTSSGTVDNLASGVISGDRHGVNATVGTTITVNNALGGQLIGRNGSGVGSDGTATVTNYGLIEGNYANIAGSDVNGLGTPGTPDGVNDGDGDGVDIDGRATIENHGTIRGTGAGGHGSDGRANTSEGIAAGGGVIENFAGATIQGAGLGILIDDSSTGNAPFQTEINNAGTITGVAGVAIRIISTFADTISNVGTISGGAGTAIEFGAGNNTLNIGAGSVIVGNTNGQGGTDLINYAGYTGGGVFVNLNFGSATGTGGLISFENVGGSAGNDTIVGDAISNFLVGAAGDDAITGGTGVDILSGDAGNDRVTFDFGDWYVSGGEGVDTGVLDSTDGYAVNMAAFSFEKFVGGSGADRIFTTSTHFMEVDGGAGADVILGTADGDLLRGGLDGDLILGNAGSDAIDGEGGADRLYGGTGRDVITGGAGVDAFVFKEFGAANYDIVTDYAAGERIELSPGDFAGLTAGVLPGSQFALGAANAAGPQVIFRVDAGNGILEYDADGTGAGAAQAIAILQGVTTFSASDVFVGFTF